MTDLRIYCSDDYKKLIKITAVQKGLSVSDFLMGIVSSVVPEESEVRVFTTQNVGTTSTANCQNRRKEVAYE